MFYVLIALLCTGIFWFVAASNPAINACTCSSGLIDVAVDVEVAVDPSQLVPLNQTKLRREETTFRIFGSLCRPVGSEQGGPVQLLLHGFTYSSQYWNPQWYGFQNYSYAEFSCLQGVSSFVYDDVCAGRSVPPQTSKDCQLPTAAAVASSLATKLKNGSVARQLTGTPSIFTEVFGIGHSLGSFVMYYSTLRDSRFSPFSGIILTGFRHITANLSAIEPSVLGISAPGREVNPARWGGLDDGFVTTAPGIRSFFYGPNGTFDPNVLELDTLTEDVGSVWMAIQGFTGNIAPATQFTGPMTIMNGGLDGLMCPPPCDPAALKEEQKRFFPNTDLNVVIIPGQGHDLNLEFGAAMAFRSMISLFKKATN